MSLVAFSFINPSNTCLWYKLLESKPKRIFIIVSFAIGSLLLVVAIFGVLLPAVVLYIILETPTSSSLWKPLWLFLKVTGPAAPIFPFTKKPCPTGIYWFGIPLVLEPKPLIKSTPTEVGGTPPVKFLAAYPP